MGENCCGRCTHGPGSKRWPIGGDFRPASWADLLHHKPRAKAINVEDVAARQFLRLRGLKEGLAANDAMFVLLDFLVGRIGEAHLHVQRNAPVAPEGAKPLREFARNLDHVGHHVDRQPGRILHEESEHEDEEQRHRYHVVHQIDVEKAHRFPGPTVVQPEVYHMHGILADRHEDNRCHSERLEENPCEKIRRARGHAVEVLACYNVEREEEAHECHEFDIDDKPRDTDLEHVRNANLSGEVEDLHENHAANVLNQVYSADLLVVNGGCVEHKEQNCVREKPASTVHQLLHLKISQRANE
mmetsp:Transcript_95515/g.270152  ORF Transcript_95515/g.270152 Transcript_95515/m.270152 type:complete len:300 (+) Transcript_95515:1220-2119(+)